MPSRPGLVAIVLFWLGTAAFVAYRDVLPRYLADRPPPLRIDLADEANANEQVKWSIFRQDDGGQMEKVGGAVTQMEYEPDDDSFWFRSEYNDFKFRFRGVVLELPQLRSGVRVGRRGELREQVLATEFRAVVAGLRVAEAKAWLGARVVGGALSGTARLETPFGAPVERPLEPVPVSGGQVLNPLMPLNRLRDLQPGQSWVIRASDPVREAVAAMLKEAARESPLLLGMAGASGGDAPELLARVGETPEQLVPFTHILTAKPQGPVDCWVIDYKSLDDKTGDFRARTWVQVSDGKVLRQEASGLGERLRFERDY